MMLFAVFNPTIFIHFLPGHLDLRLPYTIKCLSIAVKCEFFIFNDILLINFLVTIKYLILYFVCGPECVSIL